MTEHALGVSGRAGSVPIQALGEPPTRRRIVVVVITLLVGATLLGLGLTTPADQPLFYILTGSLALVWVAGAFGSGSLHLGRVVRRNRQRRPVLAPIVLGLLVGSVFVVGGLIVGQIPPLRSYVRTVLAHAGGTAVLPAVVLITLVNGAAEELFFRGALFAAVGRRAPVLITTGIYGLATASTLNPMLVFAALLLGVVLGQQRRSTGGVLAPIITHATWSLIMLLLLPLAVG